MTRHPVDDGGRVLPDPGWPSDRRAPGELELVRRFCNSVNHENGADRFSTSHGFDAWLASEGRGPTAPTTAELATIVDFREALHDITMANQQRRGAPAAWKAISNTLAATKFTAQAADEGLRLVAVAKSMTEAFLGDLALICMAAGRDGRLIRLKSCAHCEWTIYDHSKNRSGRWCSMTACGGRHNARTYRQRKRQ